LTIFYLIIKASQPQSSRSPKASSIKISNTLQI